MAYLAQQLYTRAFNFEEITLYPLGAFLSCLCSVLVRTAEAGTFSTSTSSFTRRILPALIGECSWYTVCSLRWMPSDTRVPLILEGSEMAERFRVMRKCVFGSVEDEDGEGVEEDGWA